MCMSATPMPDPLHNKFLAILPRVELHARIVFRDVRCSHTQKDRVAEAIALAWQWFRRLAERGKDATQFVSALATFAARAVRSGRRLVGQEKAQDVLSSLGQRRRGFTVSSLPQGSSLDGNVFDEALAENCVSQVPEQVCFRLDFPAWRRRWSERDRRVIDALMQGERTLDVARKYGLSPARISQKRRLYHRDWMQFHGESNGHKERPAAEAA